MFRLGSARLVAARSIYFDEFNNFVERMVVRNVTIEDYKFDLDVMKPLLDVLLDTDLGAEITRKRWVRPPHTSLNFHIRCMHATDGFMRAHLNKRNKN